MVALDIAGLSADVTALAFDLAGNAKTTAILHTANVNAFNWATDVTTTTTGTTASVEGIFYRAKQLQTAQASQFDAQFVIKGTDVPSGIDEADWLTIDGVKWNIIDVMPVPGKAVYILGLRK
jgi:alkyl hydroperoxide reductase subunit AhpF